MRSAGASREAHSDSPLAMRRKRVRAPHFGLRLMRVVLKAAIDLSDMLQRGVGGTTPL
jgi:hypothetical protein